jgi:hypothetical protein
MRVRVVLATRVINTPTSSGRSSCLVAAQHRVSGRLAVERGEQADL